MRYHIPYANKIGISDEVAENYTTSRADDKLKKLNTKGFVIEHKGKKVGILRIREDLDKKTLNIENIYILDEFRGKGIFKKVLERLKDSYNQFNYIELECWYGLPAEKVYKALGFKEIYKHFKLDIDTKR